jgi:hypothetical protein
MNKMLTIDFTSNLKTALLCTASGSMAMTVAAPAKPRVSAH